MLISYLKIALRNIKQHKGYSFINIAGLAVGMACCIIILLWVQDELSFDQFHKKISNLYMVPTRHQQGSGIDFFSSGAPPALAPALKSDYPEIVNAARYYSGTRQMAGKHDDKKFLEEIQMADSSLFEMFSFPFVKGNTAALHNDPWAIVLTEKMAGKYFGSHDPIGKTLTLDNQYDFQVKGVIKNIPYHSSLHFDFWVPMEFAKTLQGEHYISTWYNCGFFTFVELADNVSVEAVIKKIAGRVKMADPNSTAVPYLFPFSRVHLYSITGYDNRVEQVWLIGLIAFLILIIACINFMNLSTAYGARRAREVGLRKVAGAAKKQLVGQFMVEAVLFSFAALIIAVLLVELLLPTFRTLTGKPLSINYVSSIMFFTIIAGISLFTGILSGSYPALFLSSFKPVKVLKSTMSGSSKRSLTRKVLVISQFSVSIALIVSTIVISSQLDYIKNRDLGLKKEQLVYMPIKGISPSAYESIKNELLRSPDILNVTMSSRLPTGVYQNGSGWQWEGKAPDTDPLVTYLNVDADFTETFQMEMADGNFFSKESTDNAVNVVINEKFARLMGTESPVGKRLTTGDPDINPTFTIIGIVKDFHFQPLNRGIGPLVLFNMPENLWLKFRYIFIKIAPDNISPAIANIEKVFKTFTPGFPFEYRFLNEDYGNLYRSHERMGAIVRYFAILAVFISCLGLYGLASFMTGQRTKEVGIRKALGSTVPGIVLLFSREFIKWVIVANFIAWPLAYYFMNKWLQRFAYRTTLGIGVFILAGLLALMIALFTVSYQSIRTANTNPIEALRCE